MSKKKQKKIGLMSEEEFSEIVDDFQNESDRAAVILGAAKIDAQLYILLSKFFRPVTNSQDELLDGDGPLGTFSSRINAAYRLGLINSHFAKSLHLIRKIRNSFAHEIKGVSLTSGGHGDRVKELIIQFKDLEDYQQLKDDLFEGDGLGVEFRMIVAIAIVRLDTATHYCNFTNDGNETHLIPPNWTKKVDYNDGRIERQPSLPEGASSK